MNILSSMLQDGINGSVSSKRVITFLAFILCSIAFISNLFFGLKIDQFIYDSMTYIVMAGLGVTVAEKFTKPEPFKHSYYQPTRGTPLPIQKDPLI